MSKKIGFIGLGVMGFPMAVNLKKAGFEVIAYARRKSVCDEAKSKGITIVDTIKEVADQADEAIISIVRDYAQTVDVIFGEGGILSGNVKDKTIIIMSTLDPDTMNELSKRVEEESEMKLIAAAVSGGATGAEAGTLSIITSGPEDIVKSFQPYFEAVGSNIFYYGNEAGNSQVAKLVNNLILGIHMNAVAEGLKLAKHYDLPQEEVLKLLQVSTGDSWVVRNWDVVSAWTADTALSVLLKDLVAAYNKGLQNNVSMPFNALASVQLFDAMEKEKPL